MIPSHIPNACIIFSLDENSSAEQTVPHFATLERSRPKRNRRGDARRHTVGVEADRKVVSNSGISEYTEVGGFCFQHSLFSCQTRQVYISLFYILSSLKWLRQLLFDLNETWFDVSQHHWKVL